MQSDLTAHEGSDPIASCVINRSNYCEIARLARAASLIKQPETDRVGRKNYYLAAVIERAARREFP